jgi:hypothetical protein
MFKQRFAVYITGAFVSALLILTVNRAVMPNPVSTGSAVSYAKAAGAVRQATGVSFIQKDTVPPSGTGVTLYIFTGSTVTPDDFVTGISDSGKVKCEFITAPDTRLRGMQDVQIRLTDEAGNNSVVNAGCYVFFLQEALIEAGGTLPGFNAFIVNYVEVPGLSLSLGGADSKYTGEYNVVITSGRFKAETKLFVADTMPPVITGMLNKSAIVGGTVAYRKNVTVTDAYDPKPVLSINSNGVKLSEAGEYDVIYTARDASGNEANASGRVTVWEAGMAEVDEMADKILEEIITDEMTLTEKAYAIFTYVADKVKYQSGNSPRELAQAAYVCFTRGVGDCFVYNAGSQVLLTKAGIPYRVVERYNGKTEHFWLIINTGDGWYHFDASANVAVGQDERFMFTDAQAKDFTERVGNGRRYYEYDESTVPDVVDE